MEKEEKEESQEEEVRRFLSKFTQEFPAALEQGTTLPLSPLSRRVSVDELQGESVDLGLRLLTERGAPSALASLLVHSAVAELLQKDLTVFHCPLEDGQHTVLLQSEGVQTMFLNCLINGALQWQHSLPALSSVQAPPLVSVHAIKNSRRKMEDRHLVIPHFSELYGLKDGVSRSLFAVFDGHGGVDAAAFASVQFPAVLSRQNLETNLEEALTQAFTQTDLLLQQKASRERLRSGSTAVTALIQGQRLLLAWLGDSQALLVRNGQEEEVMEAHKPEREDEKRRVEELGGCVTFMGCWRVNGTYAVSRAFGDFDQRPYVSSEADVVSMELRGDEDYLLLACDGFFDSVGPSSVPGLVLEALRSLPSDSPPQPPTVAQALVSHAKDQGSSDNITVLLVFLKPPQQILQESV